MVVSTRFLGGHGRRLYRFMGYSLARLGVAVSASVTFVSVVTLDSYCARVNGVSGYRLNLLCPLSWIPPVDTPGASPSKDEWLA